MDKPQPVPESLARQLLLARAVDEADADGRLLGAAERDQLEQDALASVERHGSFDALAYLRERSRRVLAVVAKRQPRLAALQEPSAGIRALAWALPLAALLAGAAIDRIDNPQQVNMLSPPLLGVILWNLAAYLLLAAGALFGRGGDAALAAQQWLERARTGRSSRLQSDVRLRFQALWLHAAARPQVLRWKRVLHLTAAGWAAGLALSIVIGGLVRQYRVGWESTLLDLATVHAFLGALFAPVVALLPFDAFSREDLQRMAFTSGAAVGVEEARRWVWMYLALLGLLVVLPRVLLAGAVALRLRAGGARVAVDLNDAYFAGVLARVSPARVVLAIGGLDGQTRAVLRRAFEQASQERAPDTFAQPWPVLGTVRGDSLQVVEQVRDGPASPEPATQPARPWWQQRWLAGRDLPVAVGSGPSVAVAELRLLVDGAARSEGSVVLPPVAQLQNWMLDAVLLEALRGALPAAASAGYERLAQAWQDRNAGRLRASAQVLADWLHRAAGEAEELPTAPTGLRQLVSAGEREAAQRARDAAALSVVQRLRGAEAEAIRELVRLHAASAEALPTVLGDSAARELRLQQQVDSQQAGLAGAASGAAMGAGIDLMTGGMTLGAAAALGALVGGTAALTAALRRNRTQADGASRVQVSDDMLQTLTESAVLAYLAVAVRVPDADALRQALPAWRSEVVAAVAHRRDAMQPHWAAARAKPGDSGGRDGLAREMEAVLREVLARL